jgi:cellulose synthase/poly-beta-1,6-N-acetylglucosamine synthase-like glycosyltransferase
MLPLLLLLHFIATAEPVDVVEPTCIAALNLNWPGSRLVVHVLDDGNSQKVADMVKRLQFQAK